MRFISILGFALAWSVMQSASVESVKMRRAGKAQAKQASMEFGRHIQPILQNRCQPCHFTGGIMYQKLPFDRAATIQHLGDKLFSRIKDEKDQKVIRAYLAQKDRERDEVRVGRTAPGKR